MIQRIKRYIKRIAGSIGTKKALAGLSAEDRGLLAEIRSRKITYLSGGNLVSLLNTCRAIERAHLPGIFLKAGCALGGSAVLIATTKNTECPFFDYDVFGMIPPPTKEDTRDVHDRYRTIVEGKSTGIGGDKYYGYQENLYDVVQSNLKNLALTAKHNLCRW